MKEKIKALIVDDEESSRAIMKLLLAQYCPDIEVVGEASSAKLAYTKIKELRPSLLFLDVEMPYGTGFDLLRQLDKIDFEIIFVTGFDHYALQAIKYHALDYLLKPVDIDELMDAVGKVKNQLSKKIDTERIEKLLANFQNQNSNQKQIAITHADGREFIPVHQIVYCMADGACTWFYLESGRKVISSKNLGEYEKILPKPIGQSSDCFFRIHYRYLINLSYIYKYNNLEKYVEMKEGSKITIAHRRGPKFSEILKKMNLL